jgi:lipopolysaccharide export system protein LptA
MKKILPLSGIAIALMLTSWRVFALASDADQPMQIESDFAELDDESHRATYTGNVVVIQGSIKMTGDKLIANFDESRQLSDVFLNGKPAYFKQTPDGGKPDIEGQALQIEYHQLKSLLYLIDSANLKQGERIFEGYRINYDTKRSIITGRGTPTATETSKTPSPQKPARVKVIIPPKRSPAAAAPPSTP